MTAPQKYRKKPVVIEAMRVPLDGNLEVSQTANDWLHRRGYPDTLHMARHWFGTETYRSSGRDLRTTQELLRHRSVVSTQIYTALDPGPLRGAVDGLPLVA